MYEQPPSRVFRTGNSLAIRIPSGIAKQLDLEDGTPVELTLDHGTISVRPRTNHPTLDDLLERITPDNVHCEHFSDIRDNERW